MSTALNKRWIRIAWPAALGVYLAGCQQLPLVDTSEAPAKLESRHATPAASKKGKKVQPAGDSIPDAAEIGLAPTKS